MSSFTIKVVACLTMLIDHIGFLFFPESEIFRIIGRISFPLFAFLIALGFTKTRNVREYATRLTIFALISQIPYMYFEHLAGASYSINILFSLALGVMALVILNSTKHVVIKIITVLALAALSHFAKFSYGAYGMLTILGSYIFLQNRPAGAATLSILPFLETLRLFTRSIFFPQFFAIFSLIPMYLYNDKQGLMISKWWFYWFYPVHLAVLSIIFILI